MAAKKPAAPAVKPPRKSPSGTQLTYAEREATGKRTLSVWLAGDVVDALDRMKADDGLSRNNMLAALITAEAERRSARRKK
jgi:hypothetical protein